MSKADNLKSWKPGQSGNPGGRPKYDLAAEIARAVFEKNPEVIYEAMLKALKRGSPRVFVALAERAYGKLKETVEISGNISLAERLQRARKAVGIRDEEGDSRPADAPSEAIPAGPRVQ